MSRQRKRMPRWDVDLPSYSASAFIRVLLSVENEGLQKSSGQRAKQDRGCSERRTWNSMESLLDVKTDVDGDVLSICTDKKAAWDILWSCFTYVSCVIENSLRVSVQAERSCCIAPWIQLRVGGAQMAVFYVFSVLAGLPLGVVWPAARWS